MVVCDSICLLFFCLGHWVFGYQYFFSALELESIVKRQRKRYTYKQNVLVTNVVVITGVYVISLLFLISKVKDFSAFTYATYVLSWNLIFDSACTIMVTIAVLKIDQIYGCLPSHVKHSKLMIWSHLILFNVYNAAEFGLLIANISLALNP